MKGSDDNNYCYFLEVVENEYSYLNNATICDSWDNKVRKQVELELNSQL